MASLANDRLGLDTSANDGAYSTSLDLKRAPPTLLQHNQKVYGTWRVFIFSQDVNLSKPATPPEIAVRAYRQRHRNHLRRQLAISAQGADENRHGVKVEN